MDVVIEETKLPWSEKGWYRVPEQLYSQDTTPAQLQKEQEQSCRVSAFGAVD